jgi:isocitrate/isopropylmalate dehydrogenase
MLLRHIGEVDAANRLEAAIAAALAKGQAGKSTTEIADAIFAGL